MADTTMTSLLEHFVPETSTWKMLAAIYQRQTETIDALRVVSLRLDEIEDRLGRIDSLNK